MKIAVKVGPTDWQETLSKTKAKHCEVWFRLDWQKKYTPLFKYLKKNKIAFGLHFWAMIDRKYSPTLLYLKNSIAEKTFEAIKQTIDVAKQWQATYVNFHPESYRLVLLDLDKSEIKVLAPDKPINRKKSFDQLLFYLEKIKKYAAKKKIVSFIETIPKYMPSQYKNIVIGRLQIEKAEGLETEKFFQLAKMGFPICFDIGHTIGQFITDNKDKLFKYVYNAAKKMSAAIGLIHVTTAAVPFNGVDFHAGILKKDFERGATPDRKQLIKLLSLFKNKDILLVPEPQAGKMIDNYFELEKIVKEIEN